MGSTECLRLDEWSGKLLNWKEESCDQGRAKGFSLISVATLYLLYCVKIDWNLNHYHGLNWLATLYIRGCVWEFGGEMTLLSALRVSIRVVFDH